MAKQIDEFRSGATDCMAVVRDLENVLQPCDTEQTTAQYFERRDAAMAAVLAAAGPLPERARGALEALAEIIIGEIQTCGSFDFEVWRPEAVMPADEREARRRELYDIESAGLQKEPSNVVPLFGR